MESREPKWTSRCVPFKVDGPLPPRINEHLVKAAYRFFGASPHSVLRAAGVRCSPSRASHVLRKYLDDPEFRALLTRLTGPRGPSLDIKGTLKHYAAFSPTGLELAAALYLGYHLELPEYKRRIEDTRAAGANTCPVTKDEVRAILDLPKYAMRPHRLPALVTQHPELSPIAYERVAGLFMPPQASGEVVFDDSGPVSLLHGVSDGSLFSVGDSLALLAFCLIWEDRKTSITFIAEFLAGGPEVHAFFGLEPRTTSWEDAPAARLEPVSPGEAEQLEAAPPYDATARQPESPREATARMPESPREAAPRKDAAGAPGAPTLSSAPRAILRPVPPAATTDQPRGPRDVAWHTTLAQLEAARSLRQQLGSADQLDYAAFSQALEAEAAAQLELHTLGAALRDELDAALHRSSTLRSGHLNPIRLEPPAARELPALARWLDEKVPRLETLCSAIATLNARAQALTRLEPAAVPPPLASQPMPLEQALEQASTLSTLLEQQLERALDWQAHRASLQDRLADCAGPAASAGLAELTRTDVLALLRRAHVERRLRGLAPLLLRALGELEGWGEGNLTDEALECVRQTCIDAVYGRQEDVRDMMAYLPETMLQTLLRGGDLEVGRLVMYSALRDSLARQHPIFFHTVWPCAGWHSRAACVGDRLGAVFDALQRLFVRDGTLAAVTGALHAARLEHRGSDSARLEHRGPDSARLEPRGLDATHPSAGDVIAMDPIRDQLARAVHRLRSGGEGREGSWLEPRVLELIRTLGRIEVPAAFRGELPPVTGLFSREETPVLGWEGQESAEAASASVRWPSWLEASPESERLWNCRSDVQVSWTDLLQEGVARHLLERRRAPAEILESFAAAHAFSALFEAAAFPGFADSDGARQVVARARRFVDRLEMARRRIDALSRRIDAQPRLPHVGPGGTPLGDLEGPLLEAMEAVDRYDLVTAEDRLAAVGLAMVGGNLSLLCTTAWRDGGSSRFAATGSVPSIAGRQRRRQAG